jgi:hypothetical protein
VHLSHRRREATFHHIAPFKWFLNEETVSVRRAILVMTGGFHHLTLCRFAPFSCAPETGGNIHHKSPFKCFLKCFLNDERVSFRRVTLNITVEILYYFLHLTLCQFAPFSVAPEAGGNISPSPFKCCGLGGFLVPQKPHSCGFIIVILSVAPSAARPSPHS